MNTGSVSIRKFKLRHRLILKTAPDAIVYRGYE